MTPTTTTRSSRLSLYLRASLWLFLLGGGSFAILFYLTDAEASLRSFLWQWVYNGLLWVMLAVGNGWVVDRLDAAGPSWIESPVRRLIVSLLATLGFTLVAAFALIALLRLLVFGIPVWETVSGLSGSFAFTVSAITLVVSLFLHGRGFLLAWRESYLEAGRIKQAHISSQYESLRNQVNPHFLFNSLNVLSTLVYKDPDLAARFIRQLAEVYRYVLDVNREELAPLDREREALMAYLFLLETRFGEGLQVRVDLKSASGEYLAPLSLQMLVENAVKHNVATRARPLHIFVGRRGDEVEVSNDLQPRPDAGESLGIGLPNIRERYRLLTGRPVRVEQDATTFRVFLPIMQNQDAYARADRGG